MADGLLVEIEKIYRAEYRRFLRVAVGILREEERAVDAVQEAFATAVRKRRTFRGEGPLEAWIWRMVVNAALKERSKDKPLQLVDGERRSRARCLSPLPRRWLGYLSVSA
jgi:RNA polymerase sigma-70 factor (ECF subfamily)